MKRKRTGLIAATLFAVLLGGVAWAQNADVAGAADHPDFPRYDGAVIRGYAEAEFAGYRLLTGPGGEDAPYKMLQGRVYKIAYGMPADASIESVTRHYEDVTRDAYDLVFACETDDCGGLDFAYAVDLLPLPAMQFDPANYRYVVLRHAGGPGDPQVLVTLFISSYSGRVYTEVNVVEVGN